LVGAFNELVYMNYIGPQDKYVGHAALENTDKEGSIRINEMDCVVK